MAKSWSKKFYNSKAWKECRKAYISKVFGMCEFNCGESGYIVDHIEELTPENINDPNITLNHENLQYLCLECHNKKTFGKYSPLREDVEFNSHGELVRKGEV